MLCDKTDFGGDGKRIMALMVRGDTPERATQPHKKEWSIVAIPGKPGKYHILSHQGEPLYRPADDVVCDKTDFGGDGKRIMALMFRGMTPEREPQPDKMEWEIRMVEEEDDQADDDSYDYDSAPQEWFLEPGVQKNSEMERQIIEKIKAVGAGRVSHVDMQNSDTKHGAVYMVPTDRFDLQLEADLEGALQELGFTVTGRHIP